MTDTAALPFGESWAARHRTDSELMDRFQRHGRPISDVWFKTKNKTSSVSTEIQIGGLSLIAVRSDPVCFNSVPDAHLSIVLPIAGGGVISDGIASVHWRGSGQFLRTSHERSVEFGYDSVSIVTIRPDFADLSREAGRLYPSHPGLVDRLKESGSAAFISNFKGIDYAEIVLRFFKLIDACGGDRALLQRIRIDAAITRLFVALIMQQTDHAVVEEASRGPASAPSRIDLVCDRIQSSVGTPLTIGDMEDISGLTERALTEAFLMRFGCTPQEWQRNLHLDRARKQFASCDEVRSVKSVSYELGFSSVGSFLSHYRRRFGELPSDTRSAGRRPRRQQEY